MSPVIPVTTGAAKAASGTDRGRAAAAPAGGARPRACFCDVAVYDTPRDPCAVDLSDNTNLFGTPPAAARAVRETEGGALTRYPSLYCDELRAALADYTGVGDPDAIVTGCGSDQVLDATMRAFAEPGDRVAHMDPSFVIIPEFARLNGLVPVGVPLTADFDADADRLLATGARIIYLCSPNNPTGTRVSRAAVERVLERAEGLVILDEAYAEFAGESWTREIAAHGRALAVRTLSKAFGLAGLRVGYGVAAPPIVRELTKARGPYTVSAVAERGATAAIGQDTAWMRARVADAITSRERLAGALRERGLAPLPSSANFLLVPLAGAPSVGRALRARGVGVRAFGGLPVVGDALRVTVGPWPVMEAFLAGLDAVRGAGGAAARERQ